MAAIIDIYTGSRISPLATRSHSDRPIEATFRVIPGGRSPEGIRMRRIFLFRRCLAAVVLLVLVMGLGLIARAVFNSTGPSTLGTVESSESYVIHSGDTLWGVARSVSPDRDPRDVIDEIARVNSATGIEFDVNHPLTPGQKLLLPAAS